MSASHHDFEIGHYESRMGNEADMTDYRQNPSKAYNGVRHQTSMCPAFVKLGRAFGDNPVGVRIGAGEVGVNIPVPLSADSLGLEEPLGKALRVAEAGVPSLVIRSIGAGEETGEG